MSLAAQQRVFRVRKDAAGLEPARLQEVGKARRTHKKSRSGCQACKQRRIKCDEILPRCSYCQRQREGLDCVYPPAPSVLAPKAVTRAPSTLMHDLSLEMVQLDLGKLLGASLQGRTAQNLGSDAVHALQHFRNVTSKTLGGKAMQDVMYEYVPLSAWQQPFIMHMIMALSSAHLRRLSNESHRGTSYALLEAVHWQHGLENYRAALSTAGEATSQDFGDALVTGTLLSIFYTNCLVENMSQDAFIIDYDAAVDAMTAPFAVSYGIRALRMALGTFTPSSALNSIFPQRCRSSPENTDVPDPSVVLEKICRLETGSEDVNSLVKKVSDRLAPMMPFSAIDDQPENILSFGGIVYPDMRLLLERRSPEAMMLLLCWFTSLARMNQWWAKARMKAQSKAIRRYLSTLIPPTTSWSECLATVFEFIDSRIDFDE